MWKLQDAEDLLADERNYANEHSKTVSDHSRPSPTAAATADTLHANEQKEHSSKEKQFSEPLDHSERDDYEDKEITFLSGDDDEASDALQHSDILEEHPESDNEGLGLPLLPEVSMEVDGNFDLKHQIQQVSSRSWMIPHSSTSGGNRGNYGASKPFLKRFGTGGDGILMRMMKEPLKSSLISSQAHVLYDLDET